MSNRHYDRRYDRKSGGSLWFLLFLVAFGGYIAFDNGWIGWDTLGLSGGAGVSGPPSFSESSLPPCSQNGNVPPCALDDAANADGNPEPANVRLLTFVDGAGNPIVGMPVKLWRDGAEIESTTNERGEVAVYTEGFDPNVPESYIKYAGTSQIISGKTVIVVNDELRQ